MTRLSLVGNWRCSRQIVQCANRLVNGTMESVRDEEGSVLTFEFENEDEEIGYLVNFIQLQCSRTARNAGTDVPYEQTAVLVRYNVLVERYASALERYGIPVARNQSVVPKDWARAMRLISFMSNPDRDSNALYYIEASEGKEAAKRAKELATEKLCTVNQLIWQYKDPIPVSWANDILDRGGIEVPVIDIIEKLEQAFPYPCSHSDLLMAMNEYESETPQGLGVTVCTVHAAKSREWSTVFCPAFEQGILPKDPNDQEDRRIAYVAVTRAADTLVLTHVRHRTDLWSGTVYEAWASQFIKEMGL